MGVGCPLASWESGVRRGFFIVLEGADGAGTTTQRGLLEAALRAEGHPVLSTREPSDGPVGALLRQVLSGRCVLPGGAAPGPEALALLFAADRMDHLQARVLPALAAGQVVVSDRYVLSSLAYQGAALPMAWVAEVNRYALPADVTYFLEVPEAVASARRAARGGPVELFDAQETQRKVAEGYARALQLHTPESRLVRVDGSRPPLEVAAHILRDVRRRLAAPPQGPPEA